MDRLLTPLVTGMLRQYVKRSAEGAGSDLKVSFSRGNVLTLHNLELNLAPLLGGAAALAHVRRAFARRLSITIPWTALTTQPIQVVLDTVELVLSAAEQSPAPTPVASAATIDPAGSSDPALAAAEEEAAAAAAAAAAGGGGSSWLGSTLQSMALRAGLNVTVQLTNVVVKWVQQDEFVAAATFQQLLMQTSTDEWQESLQNPDAWLKKECSIRQLSFSLDQHRAGGGTTAPAHSYQPLLRIASLRAAALLPAFAWLEGAELAGDPFNTSVEVQLSPLHVAMNDRQLRWAGSLAALMQAAAAAKAAAAAAEQEAVAAAAAAAARLAAITGHRLPAGSPPGRLHVAAAAVGGSTLTSGDAAAPTSPFSPAAAAAARPQTKALGVFGRVWDFLIDEAHYVEAAEDQLSGDASSPLAAAAGGGGQQQQQQQQPAVLVAMPMHAELSVILEQLHVTLGVVEDRRQRLLQEQQPQKQQPQQVGAAAEQQQQQQQLAMAPDLAATLQQLRAATASNSREAVASLQKQLAEALASAGAGGPGGAAAAVEAGQRHGSHQPPYCVHPFAELLLEHLRVAVASVDASISGVAAELQRLSLRRNTAAAPLLAHLLVPLGDPLGGGADSDAMGSRLQAVAAAAAVAVAGSDSWVDVVALEADPQQSAAAEAHMTQRQQAQAHLAVSLHYYDSGAGPNVPAGAAKPPAVGQLRCSVAVGRLLVAHAPGFATSLLLFAGQFSAAAAASPFVGKRLPGSSSGDLAGGSAAGSPVRSPYKGAAAEPPRLPSAGAALPQPSEPETQTGGDAAGTPLLVQAMQPQLLLECRVAEVELAVLASQAPDAAAAVLLLRQLELRSGPLNWEAPWNTRLRHALLAPPDGFGSHGLRLSLASATLGVAELPDPGSSGGLWQLQHAAAISTAVQLDAVAAEAPSLAGAAGGGGRALLSAALSPLQVHMSGQQAAVLAAVAGNAAAELQAGFQAPLAVEQSDAEAALPLAWLAKFSLSSATGMQMAYAAGGGLAHWRDPRNGSALTPANVGSSSSSGSSSDDAPQSELYLGLGSITTAVSATPEPAAAAATPASGRHPTLPPGHQHLVLNLQLEEPRVWLQPALAVWLPLMEARLGSAADLASPTLQPEPLLLAAGLSYERREQLEQAEGPCQRRCSRKAVRLGSLSLAVGAADYPLLLGLLRCVRQQPALPPRPTLVAAGREQQQQTSVAVGAAEEAVEEEIGLQVRLDAASISIWPLQPAAPQQQQQQQIGLTAWLSRLQLQMQHAVGALGGSSSTELTLASVQAALVRRQQQPGSSSSPLELSPVLCFTDGAAERQQGRRQQQQAALTLALRGSWAPLRSGVRGGSPSHAFSPVKSPASRGSSGRQLQLHAAPLSVAVSSELLAAVGTISGDLGSTGAAGGEQQLQQLEQPDQPEGAALEAAEAAAIQGKAALQGVRLLLQEAASWGDQWGPQHGPQQQPPAPAVELEIEEAVVLLQRVPAAENRPWLSAGRDEAAGALLSSADASLIGAAITVWHEGPPGADATALLPPTDGRMQLLLQPHSGAVGMALHAQMLPLQLSVPAVSALSSVISTLFSSEEEQPPQQPQHRAAAVPSSSRPPLPSASAVAAAATVIIEDASATLEHHRRTVATGRAGAEPSSNSQEAGPHLDDLAAALFTYVHSSGSSAASRPAPLQVQTFAGGSAGFGDDASAPRSGLRARLWAAASGGGPQDLPAVAGQQLRRQGIRWCYPQPRGVALLAVEDPPSVLLAASFQLSCYSPDAGAYLALPLQAVEVDRISVAAVGAAVAAAGSGTGSALLLIAEEAVAAAEWQVSWELPPGAPAAAAAAASAAAVLQRLRVNPRGWSEEAATAAGMQQQLLLPPPLAAYLTVALTAEGASLALLAPAPLLLLHGRQQAAHQQPAPAALLDVAAVLHLGGLKAALHTYPAPKGYTRLAGDLQAHLALCLPDSSSATAPPGAAGTATAPGVALLEPFLLDCAVEYSTAADGYQQQQQEEEEGHAEQAEQVEDAEELGSSDGERGSSEPFSQHQRPPPMFWLAQAQQSELALLAVRPPPRRGGLAVQLAARQQPVVVNASEGSLAEMKHLLAALSSPLPSSGTSGSCGGEPNPAAAAAAAAPLLLVNLSGMALCLRQEGAAHLGQLLLQDGQRLPLVWPAPPALVPGATRRLQVAPAAAAEDDKSAWSLPLDVMASGGHQLVLPPPGGDSGAASSLAVLVLPRSGAAAGWEARFLPGLRVENHLAAPLHFSLASEGDQVPGYEPSSPPAQQRRQRRQHHTAVDVASGGNASLHQPVATTQLRLWLGGGAAGASNAAVGGGWSQAVELPQLHQLQEPLLMILHGSPAAAASATAAGLDTPETPAAQHLLGSVLAQLLPPDSGTGQASLHFWPPLLLRNSMPCPLRLLLPAAVAATAATAPPVYQHQQVVEVVLQPGASHQLAVPLQGGTVGALLALEPAAASSSSGGSGGSSRALAIVVPPLIAESAEQQWFGASGPSQVGGKAAPAAVYIAPPGEATCLRLPLLLAAPGDAAAAVSGSSSSKASSLAVAADCVLATQHHTEGLPCMQLSLLPVLAVHNCLPVPLLFQVPGAAAVEVPAGHSLPLALGSSGTAEEAAVLLPIPVSGEAPSSSPELQQPRQVLLRSQAFSLDCSGGGGGGGGGSSSIQLVLQPEAAQPACSTSRLWGGAASSSGEVGGGSAGLECRLAALIEAQQYVAAGGDATVESVTVTITAGCYVSNLSGLALAMLPEGTASELLIAALAAGEQSAAQSPVPLSPESSVRSLPDSVCSGGSARLGSLLGHAATVPLMHLWRAGGGGGSDMLKRHQRQRSWSGTGDMLRSLSGALLPPTQAAAGAGKPALRFALAAPSACTTDGDTPTPRPELQHEPAAGQKPPTAAPTAAPLGPWSAALLPYAAAGRQRLYLQQPDADGSTSAVMLTYRVLLTRGCFHLVLFRDRQPPFVVQNTTAALVDIGFFPPTEASDGSCSYDAKPRSALRVGPGHTLECDFYPSSSSGGSGDGSDEAGGGGTEGEGMLAATKRAGSGATGGSGWEDQEDEDAFLDCLLQEELRAAVQQQQRPPPVLKFRPSGAKEWLHPCVLLPGLHLAGGGSGGGGKGGSTAALAEVHISRCCATTRILLLPEASEVGGDCAAAAAAAATTAEQPRPLWIELRCGQLQVCLWDDERQRLLPAAVAGGGPTLGRELFSLSIDRLHLQLSRQVLLEPAAAAAAALQRGDSRRLHPWQQQALVVTSARLTATALQLDSFLPGSEQPVLLTSLPEGSIAATSLGSLPQRHGPPLQLALEIHHCPPLPALAVAGGGGSCPEEGSQGGSGMSFRNAWVHDMLIQLPTLAAAADDALLLFGERLSSLLAGSGGGDDNSSINGGEGIPVASSGAAGEGSAPPLGAVAGSSGTQQPPALATLQQSLATEAAGAAASRLYIEQAVVESVRLLLDAHIAAGTAGVPVAVDTHRAPVTLSRIAAHDVLFRPHILVRGLMAHGVAEALLNAPQVLGSLSLLFNPTGLVRSVRAGVADLIGLPLAALQNQSLAQFISGVGLGSVSLVRHTLGWTLTSISGFSQAFARAVDSAVTIRTSTSGGGGPESGGGMAHRPAPAHLGHGLSQGVASLAEGVAAGITGVVRAPMQGYSSGSGVLGGIGRGLLGAVGLPVSGALELVGAVSAGLASSAGVVYVPRPRRDGRLMLAAESAAMGGAAAGDEGPAPTAVVPVVVAAARLMQHPTLLVHPIAAAGGGSTGPGRYLAHAPLVAATVLQGAGGLRGGGFEHGFALHLPLLLVTEAAAVLFAGGGLDAVLVLPLAATETEVRYSSQEVRLFSTVAAPAGQPDAAGSAAVLCQLSREAWLRLAPLLRQRGEADTRP